MHALDCIRWIGRSIGPSSCAADQRVQFRKVAYWPTAKPHRDARRDIGYMGTMAMVGDHGVAESKESNLFHKTPALSGTQTQNW